MRSYETKSKYFLVQQKNTFVGLSVSFKCKHQTIDQLIRGRQTERMRARVFEVIVSTTLRSSHVWLTIIILPHKNTIPTRQLLFIIHQIQFVSIQFCPNKIELPTSIDTRYAILLVITNTVEKSYLTRSFIHKFTTNKAKRKVYSVIIIQSRCFVLRIAQICWQK